MISYLQGKILQKKSNYIILLVDNIGYQVFISKNLLLQLKNNQELSLYIYQKVSDNAIDLYGFLDCEEKDFFELLISVKGVGPRGALSILDLGSLIEIKQAIARQDSAYLTQVSGIGKRTAERMVVELKTKIKDFVKNETSEFSADKAEELLNALLSLGYSKEEARLWLKDLPYQDYDVPELLKMILKKQRR